MSKICDKCGAELEDNDKFCDKCGAKIKTTSKADNKKKSSKISVLDNKKIIIGILILVIAIIAVMGATMQMNVEKTEIIIPDEYALESNKSGVLTYKNNLDNGYKLEVKEDIQEQLSKIKEYTDQIEEYEKQILELTNLKQCENCKNKIDKNAKFCPECGTEQPEEVVHEVEVVDNDEETVNPENSDEEASDEAEEAVEDAVEEKEEDKNE